MGQKRVMLLVGLWTDDNSTTLCRRHPITLAANLCQINLSIKHHPHTNSTKLIFQIDGWWWLNQSYWLHARSCSGLMYLTYTIKSTRDRACKSSTHQIILIYHLHSHNNSHITSINIDAFIFLAIGFFHILKYAL